VRNFRLAMFVISDLCPENAPRCYQSGGTEQSIDYRVTKHIAIGVRDEALAMRNFHASKNQMRAGPEPMQVEADPDSKFHVGSCSWWRRNRASAKSPGRVIFMLLSDPRTTATGKPRRSTRLDSSVP
jgi:hypothetical protein